MTDLVARLQQVAAAVDAPAAPERSDLDALETGTSEPFTGGTSEPFDTGSEALLEDPGGDPVDSQAWGRESLELSRPSGEWDKNKIIAAPKVGPEEWTPDDSEDRLGSDAGPSGSSLRDPRRQGRRSAGGEGPRPVPEQHRGSPAPRDALMAAIEAAAATKESTADGPAAPGVAAAAEGGVPSAKASGRRKRQAGAPARTEAGEAGNKKVVLLGAAGVLVLVLVAAFAFGRSDPPPGGGKTTETSTGATDVGPTTATQRPPDTEPDPAQVAKDKKRERAKLEGVKYATDAGELVRSQRYREVAELKARLPQELLEEPALSEKVAAIDEAMKKAVDERLGRETAAIEAKLAAEDWDGAQADLRKTQQWVPTPDTAAPLVAKVKQAVDARDAPVRDENTGEQVDVATFKNDLEARCKGMANGFVYPNGGVVLNYPIADEALLADLTNVAGPDKVTLDPGDGGKPVILLRSTAKPIFVVLPLAYKQLIDITVDLVVRKVGSAPKVALLQGFRPMSPRGTGLLWGIQQASIADPRDGLKFITKPIPELPADGAPIRLRLRFPRRSTEQVEVSGFLRLPGRDVPADKMPAVNLTKLEGQVGVWVEDAEVAIIGLQVRGIVDPAANR
jgi:Arc/MetJ family transcription regulator